MPLGNRRCTPLPPFDAFWGSLAISTRSASFWWRFLMPSVSASCVSQSGRRSVSRRAGLDVQHVSTPPCVRLDPFRDRVGESLVPPSSCSLVTSMRTLSRLAPAACDDARALMLNVLVAESCEGRPIARRECTAHCGCVLRREEHSVLSCLCCCIVVGCIAPPLLPPRLGRCSSLSTLGSSDHASCSCAHR
jgi:hypothetical protein